MKTMKNFKSKISVFVAIALSHIIKRTPKRGSVPFVRLALNLLAIALCIGTTACNSTDNKTWHCYDRQGNPAEGVVILCHWGLANYDKHGVTCRMSDANGKIVLDGDADTPFGLSRGDACIYSSKLRSGSVGMGKRWHETEPEHEIQPIPDTAVYFDEWNNKIYLKSGVDDPVIWHNALNHLISSYGRLRGAPNGGAKLNAMLSGIVPHERALFLEKYGERIVPSDYLKTASVNNFFGGSSKRTNSGIKFKDITLPLPKP